MRLRERLHAWRFFLPRILLIFAGFAAVVLPVWFRSGDAWRWALALSLLLAALTITSAARNWMSVVGRRALALGGVVAFALIYLEKLPSAWTVVAVLVIGAGTMARRQIGSPSPRFIGVPRPDVVDEVLSPVEGTSDDAERLVDALDGVWGSTREGGPRQGRRAAHADGSGACGCFELAADIDRSRIDRIPMFRSAAKFDALVRFSNFWGFAPRDDSRRTPRGMAIKLVPYCDTDQAVLDFVLIDARRFPVNSRDDLYGFLRAFGKPLQLVVFLLLDRTRLRALAGTVALRSPRSYLTRTYHSVNTFFWDGQPVRFAVVPRSIPELAPTATGDRRWLLDADLRKRLERGTASFEVRVVVGRGLPQRVLLDARRAWPRGTPAWTLGTLHLRRYVGPTEIDRFAFDPHNLPAGIEPSADEILMARRAAYAESRLRRCPI